MSKRGGLQLSVNFTIVLILSVAALAMGIVFIRRIHSSSGGIAEHIDEQTKQELLRLRNDGWSVALVPKNVERRGVVALMITNDGSVDINEFGFKVSFDVAFANDRNEIPIDPDVANRWILRPGSEDTAYEIKPRESREFMIAVNPTGKPQPGTYIFNVDVRYESNGVPNIQYGMGAGKDELYKSLLKFYVKV